ncbi:MAG: hypothetical protein WD795_05175 [Woeseia sp.]
MTDDKRLQRPLTEERKKVFLDTLAETGMQRAAAAAATPWSTSEWAGLSTFQDERKRDPEFALAWDKALEVAIARIEAEIVRRAMEPERRPVFSKGELVGEHLTYDNKLLMRLATRHDPAWREKQEIEHTGTVQHQHTHDHIVFAPKDIVLLEDPEERRLFVKLALKLGELIEQREAPNVIEHQSD